MREMEERGLNTDMNWNESSKIGQIRQDKEYSNMVPDLD